MTDGLRAGTGKRLSLSPVTVSSTSDHSKHSSVSPPKIIAVVNKSGDGGLRPSLDRRPFKSYQRPRNVYHGRKYRSRSRSRDKSPRDRYRSRSRSRSLPKRYRLRSRSRSRGRFSRSQRSRSRSHGRHYRNRRSRSRSSGKTSRSRRSRSRSTSSYSKSSSRRLEKSRSRSREHSRKKYKSKSPSHRSENVDMRSAWETFQAELSALESIRAEEERLYDKDPEKHPDYKVEWKKFYKGRVQEILDNGDDPKLHKFESEWAYFWKFRMSELINLDYEKKKVALKRRLRLPENAEMPLYLKYKESKGGFLDSGMFQSHADSLISSKMFGNTKGLISTLRIVTAVEEQLGSLGPRVNSLLSEAVSLQRISGNDPDSLLSNPETYVLLETVKEKLIGQIQSNIVRKAMESAVEEAINSIILLLKFSAPPNPSFIHNQQFASSEKVFYPQSSAMDNNVNVPGVGEVDRVAIAQQIADALIKQGKTDVTEAELQELVNGVVGMVEAQAAQERERELASLRERLQMQEPVRAEVNLEVIEEKKLVQEMPVSTTTSGLDPVAPPESTSIPDPPVLNKYPSPVPKENDALSMLMSVVKSGIKKTEPIDKSHDWSSDDSEEITIKKSPASSHVDKNPANDSEKQIKNDIPNLKVEFNRNSEVSKRTPSSERQGISATFAKKEPLKWYSLARKSPSPEIFKSMKKKVAAAKGANERKKLGHNRSLSPFSTREETSNPLPNSEEEDEDLKVIGAWDSDSDIDLDSFGKTKGLAYDKINVKRLSPGKYEKNMSLLNKSKEVLQNTVVAPPTSVSADINLDDAIDNLMGELKNKTSKIEVISTKPQAIAKPQITSSNTTNVGEASKNGHPIPSQFQQTSSNKVVTAQGYNAPYGYTQPQLYGVVQPGYYSNSSVPSYTQGGVGYYGNQGGTASAYYGNSGNLVYCPTNVQWQSYYGSQQTNVPSHPGDGTKYGKY